MSNISETPGRPRSSSFELCRPSSNKAAAPDYGSFTVTHTDVPSQHKHNRRSKSLGNIKDSLQSFEEKNAFAKLLRSRLNRSSDSMSNKSWSSSECDMVIYEEDEEEDMNDSPKV